MKKKLILLIFTSILLSGCDCNKSKFWIIENVFKEGDYVFYMAESPNEKWYQQSSQLRFIDDAGKFNIGDTVIIVKK